MLGAGVLEIAVLFTEDNSPAWIRMSTSPRNGELGA
jgi:hypothetical protein